MIRSRGFLLFALCFVFTLSGMALSAQAPGDTGAAGLQESRAAGGAAGGGSAGANDRRGEGTHAGRLGLDGKLPQPASGHPRHQDGGRPHGCPQLGGLFRRHECGRDGSGQRHGVSRGHRNGVELGRGPGAGRRPHHRAAGEGPGTGHDPGAHGEHQPHAALGPELRGLWRRSLPRRAHGGGLHPGSARRGRHPFRQALRGQQPGVRAPPHRREDRPAHAARDLLPGLQGGRGRGRGLGGDVRLQQGEWPVVRREPVPADGDAQEALGLQGLRHLRLGQHVQHRGDDQRGHGPGDARRRADAQLARQAADARRRATAADGSPRRRFWPRSPRAR